MEMSQLQLMRRLVVQMVRHARNLLAEGRAPRVSSVRQMMAGTRISDSSPYESPNDEPGPSGLQRRTEPSQPSKLCLFYIVYNENCLNDLSKVSLL